MEGDTEEDNLKFESFQTAISELTSSIPWTNDKFTQYRFFAARDKDPKLAEEMIRNAVEWQTRINLHSIMEEWGDQQGCDDMNVPGGYSRNPKTERAKFADNHSYCGKLKATTNAGAPILVQRLGLFDLSGTVREELTNLMMHSWCYMLQDGFLSVRSASLKQNKMVKAALVIDLDGIGFSIMRHMATIKAFSRIGKTYFAEVTKTVTIVNAPMFFAGMWSMISPILPAASRAKVSILGRDFKSGLAKHADIDPEVLPTFLGGNGADDEVCFARPIERGCADFKFKDGTIPDLC